jgi:predicted acetyltransferase
MLHLNILNAKKRGIEKLLVTCDADNDASEKIILANGGVFESLIDVDGIQMKRYWITTKTESDCTTSSRQTWSGY